jgi:hypothetical protein
MDKEERIRELAYKLWVDEGCPEGRATDHWQRATEIIDSEKLDETAAEAIGIQPTIGPKSARKRGTRAAPAQAHDADSQQRPTSTH